MAAAALRLASRFLAQCRAPARDSTGRQEGRFSVLVRLLQLKFGPLSEATQQRLEQTDEARLDLWTERVLSAQSLDEVFA